MAVVDESTEDRCSACATPTSQHAGDKCFLDYASQTAEVIDRSSGEIRPPRIFVAVLGCSNYTYAETTWTQTLADWLGAHVRALEFFGGAPAAFVPDLFPGTKSGLCAVAAMWPTTTEVHDCVRRSASTRQHNDL